MLEGLTFGWRTAILAVAIGQLLVLAAALARTLRNRPANRTMAVLLLVLAGIVTPWMIGFAGFYDKWRWLTFAPFQITLAVAPLLWLYVHALVQGRWPDRGVWHLAPAVAQFAVLTGSFLLPMPVKERWAEIIVFPLWVVTSAGLVGGLIFYGLESRRLLRGYRQALAAARSDDHRYAARWLNAALAAGAALFAVWTGYLLWDLFSPLGYTGLMGLYVAIALFALYLGIEAWRHAALPFPALADLAPAADTLPPPKDWTALGEAWAAKIRAEGWAADPELSLPVLARRLGTNSGHLSRALNSGLGVSFSNFVNGLRSEAVAAMIEGSRSEDLLDLALEAGFSSKASFNRAFSARFGMAPSAWRKRHVSNRE